MTCETSTSVMLERPEAVSWIVLFSATLNVFYDVVPRLSSINVLYFFLTTSLSACVFLLVSYTLLKFLNRIRPVRIRLRYIMKWKTNYYWGEVGNFKSSLILLNICMFFITFLFQIYLRSCVIFDFLTFAKCNDK